MHKQMSMRLISISLALGCVALALVACGSKSTTKSKKDKSAYWLGRTLKPFSGKVEGVGVTVQLPDGLKPKAADKALTGYYWQPTDGDEFDYPQFSISTHHYYPESPAAARKWIKDDGLRKGHVVTRAEAVNGGFLLAHHNAKKKYLITVFFRKVGKKILTYQAIWIRSRDDKGPVPKLAKIKAWMEKICLTLTVKG